MNIYALFLKVSRVLTKKHSYDDIFIFDCLHRSWKQSTAITKSTEHDNVKVKNKIREQSFAMYLSNSNQVTYSTLSMKERRMLINKQCCKNCTTVTLVYLIWHWISPQYLQSYHITKWFITNDIGNRISEIGYLELRGKY